MITKHTHLLIFTFLLITCPSSIVCMEVSSTTYPITLCQPNNPIKLVTNKKKPCQPYDELIKTNKKITILRTEEPHERFDKCYTVAITEHLGITGEAPKKLKISHTEDLLYDLKIIDNYYELIKKPALNSLVAYVNRKKNITHLAIVTHIDETQRMPHKQVRVKSKWGMFPEIIEHRLFDIPVCYGKHVRFYNLKKEYEENKKYFLETIQKQINSCTHIQKKLKNEHNILIALAKGENVFLEEDDEIFNTTYTLLQKTTFLLKTCMGIDINTHTKTNQHTILMLATKRNDIEMMKLFLAMGADPHKKNIHNQTALMIAQASHFTNAVEILKKHGADY